MSELGLTNEKITLEHTLVLATSKVLEKQIDALFRDSNKRILNVVELVGYGAAAYFVLSGELRFVVFHILILW